MPTVDLTDEEYATLCGVVQPDDDVNAAGIFSGAWETLREKFPLRDFEQWADDHPDFYEEDAGL